jgi:hypothetical protein
MIYFMNNVSIHYKTDLFNNFNRKIIGAKFMRHFLREEHHRQYSRRCLKHFLIFCHSKNEIRQPEGCFFDN